MNNQSQWGFRVLLTLGMTMPMLVLYSVSSLSALITEDLNIQPGSIGYLVASAFGIASVLSVWAGGYVNRYGAKNALILLFFAVACAFALVSVFPSYISLILAAGLCGISQALANPCTNVLITKNFPVKDKAKVVGLKQAGVQFAALIAGLILPSIGFAYGWQWAYACLVPVALACTWWTFHRVNETEKGKVFLLEKPNRLLLNLMAIQFCVGFGLSAFVTFLPSFATTLGMSKPISAYLIALFGLVGMLSRIVLTPLGTKLKNEALLLLLLIGLSLVSVVIMQFFTQRYIWVCWLAVIGVGGTAVATNAIAMSMVMRDKAFGKLSIASGFISVAFFGGYAVGPSIFGYLINSLGDYQIAWVIVCIVFSIAMGLSVSLSFIKKIIDKRVTPELNATLEKHAT